MGISLSTLLPLNVRWYKPKKFFESTRAQIWVLVHFVHQIQHFHQRVGSWNTGKKFEPCWGVTPNNPLLRACMFWFYISQGGSQLMALSVVARVAYTCIQLLHLRYVISRHIPAVCERVVEHSSAGILVKQAGSGAQPRPPTDFRRF